MISNPRFLALFACLAHGAVTRTKRDQSLITPAATLKGRQLPPGYPCGFYIATDTVTAFNFDGVPTASFESLAIWSWQCNYEPCVINTLTSPNIVFCTTPGEDYITQYYANDNWPSTGCGVRESCCPSEGDVVLTARYDGGATISWQCGTNAAGGSGWWPVYTSLAGQSFKLAVYTPPFTSATTTSTSVTPTSTTVTLSSTRTTGVTSGSSTITSTSSSANISSITHTSSATSGNEPATGNGGNGLSTASEIGSILGAIFGFIGAIGVGVSIYLCRRKLRRDRERERR